MADFFDTLRAVLKEVCEFLSNEANPKAKALLKRVVDVNNQASLIAITDTSNYTDMNKRAIMADEYVGPDAKSGQINGQNSPDDVYSTPDDIGFDGKESKVEQKLECPYKNALLNELVPIKSSTLKRKESIFSILRGNREYFVVLLDEWLLFYNSNKKHHAQEVYPLPSCKATDLDDKGTFSLNVDSNKAFTMLAETKKEKLQWISAINNITNYKTSKGLESFRSESDDKMDKIKHISIESNGSNKSDYYAAIDENQCISKPCANRVLPETPDFNSNNNQNGAQTPQAPPRVSHVHNIPRSSTAPIHTPDDEDIYQFVSTSPSSKPEYSNDEDRSAIGYPPPPSVTLNSSNSFLGKSQRVTQPLPPEPEEIYQFVEPPSGTSSFLQSRTNQTQDISNLRVEEQETYSFVDSGYPVEDIYESIAETDPREVIQELPRDGIKSGRESDVPVMRHKPEVPEKRPKVPFLNRDASLLNELKLKHKLKRNPS